MNQENIEKILSVDLFEELGLENLSVEEKMALSEEMAKVVLRGIWLKVLENLSPEKQNELEALLSNAQENNQELITNFLKKEIPNFEEMIKEEIASYKSLLMSEVNK